MNIKDKLSKICNYSEISDDFLPQISLAYIDFVEDSEAQKRELIQKKRNISINFVLDEVDDVENDNITWVEGKISDISAREFPADFGTISAKVMSINIKSQRYIKDDQLYNEVIDFLDINTQTKHSFISDYITTEDYQENVSKILFKINISSNYIATDGRIGPATSVIVGRKNWHWFEDTILSNIPNISIILDENISYDKIIVSRGKSDIKSTSVGLILINNIANNNYYFKETNNWEKQYAWFNII